MHMCMVWPCYSFVDGLSYKCINVYIQKRKKSQIINHDCLPIFMLMYIMLAYLMLFAVLSNAVSFFCHRFFINAFCLCAFSWFIDT